MKNIFKFAAMAFAAVVLAGGATSCEEKEEGMKATIHPILKQWENVEQGLVFDFGTTTPNQIYYSMLMMGQENEETGKIELMAMSLGKILSIEETDATSGTIKVEAETMDENYKPIKVQGEIPYKDLTINSVTVDAGIISGCKVTGQDLKLVALTPYVWAPMPEM